eukprot:7747815-Lingulodinium_polyedra.AAC.1
MLGAETHALSERVSPRSRGAAGPEAQPAAGGMADACESCFSEAGLLVETSLERSHSWRSGGGKQ